MAWGLCLGFAGELRTSTLLCLSRAHQSMSSVNICGHRIMQDKSGEDPGNGQKLPNCHRRMVSAITYFNNCYFEFEHTRPAGLGPRTAMNMDKINI
jgi:hypothetical protein